MVRIAGTSVEQRGEGVYHVEVTVENTGYFPTALSMGLRARTAPPVTVRLLPADGLEVLSNDLLQQQVRNLPGSGGRATVDWLLSAREGTRVTVEVLSMQGGGLRTTTLTLREEDR
jgi:hypothetical protein